MEKKINLRKVNAIVAIIYFILGITFYIIGGEQLKVGRSKDSISYENSVQPIGEITSNVKIEQLFYVNSDIIQKINIKLATYGRENKGTMYIKLININSKEELFNETVDISQVEDGKYLSLNINKKFKDIKNKPLELIITSNVDDINNAITIWSGKEDGNSPLFINGVLNENTLTFSVDCGKELWFGKYYWYIFGLVFILLLFYLINLDIRQKSNKKSIGINILTAFFKYKFLLSQLIERDFKTKYKRSVLGVLWSFLNPLLTMLVQYIVFSTIFKTDIPNFPVYLLSGIVIFNFFTESSGMGLMSIVGNASLITKVYMPKYIYPVSKVFSSVINLLLSLIPLVIVMILTKVKIGGSILLIPFGLICTIIFCIGISFILSSAMVFFRDTQFLWNVLSLLWMYATPIFYPETIIPDKFSFIFKLNPLYHFIRFVRTCILNGVSPEPIAYLYCLIFSIGTLIIGAIIFKKSQDKFVLNI